MTLSLTRAASCRMHSAILTALREQSDIPNCPQSAKNLALARLVSDRLENEFWDISDAISLAQALMNYIYDTVQNDYVAFDVKSVEEACGSRELALVAINLCGGWPKTINRNIVEYVNAPEEITPVTHITFPKNMWLGFYKSKVEDIQNTIKK